MSYQIHLFRGDCRWLHKLPWDNDPHEWICAGGAAIKKTKTRFAFVWPGEIPIFIKRYVPKRFSARWLSWLLGTKSAREAQVLFRLRSEGIAAPEPLAVIEPSIPIGRMANYLVQERLAGDDLLRSAQLSPENAGSLLASAAEELGRLLAQLHFIGFFHPDTALCNFFLDAPTGKLHVIDVDDGRFFPRILLYHRRRNLRQIISSGRSLTEDREWVTRLYDAYTSCSGISLEAIAPL
ncbi:MAG: lipopolysaccharide kinase InaA family protein [bacterium]